MAEIPVEQEGKPLKYTVTHYRQPQHTHEAFIKWIVEDHLPVAMPIFQKHGILGYSLVSTPAEIATIPRYLHLIFAAVYHT